MRWLLCAALLLVPLAGCVGTGVETSTTTPPPQRTEGDIWRDVNQAMAGVPCKAPYGGSVTESTQNLKLLSALAIPAERDGIHAELDVRGDLAVHARYDSGGFEVYDLSDPLRPRHLGNFTDALGALDVKFSPDNRTVLVGTDTGIVMADISDPRNVTKAGEWSFTDVPAFPRGPSGQPNENAHMLYTARIGGADWVFLAPNSNSGI